MMKKVTVGIIGSGFAANLHAQQYRYVYGLDIDFKSVASVGSNIKDFADKYGIRMIYSDHKEMLLDPEIDVIDIVTPPFTHKRLILDAINAGKNVICEKPITGSFNTEINGKPVSKLDMYNEVNDEMEFLRRKFKESGLQFMYAENWIYFPALQKANKMLGNRKSKILRINAEAGHSGSHAEHANVWALSGGGSLIRHGCHPIGAAIYLKKMEGRRLGEDIRVKEVIADTETLSSILSIDDKRHFESSPINVEDVANVLITFTDNTKATIFAADIVLGGYRNIIDIQTNDSIMSANVSPNPGLVAYLADDHGLGDIRIAEKVGNKNGWQFVEVNEDIAHGYRNEIQDFMECVAYGRMPLSGFDIAYETIRTVYAAYASVESGRRIRL